MVPTTTPLVRTELHSFRVKHSVSVVLLFEVMFVFLVPILGYIMMLGLYSQHMIMQHMIMVGQITLNLHGNNINSG
jgi:hypothetical protein